MYSISKGGVEIGVTERPAYIRTQENGTYALCEEENAQGICYNGTVYHVWGRPEIDGDVESVALTEFDGGTRILELYEALNLILSGGTGETEVGQT